MQRTLNGLLLDVRLMLRLKALCGNTSPTFHRSSSTKEPINSEVLQNVPSSTM